MNKSILKQALELRNNKKPAYGKVEKLYKMVLKYQEEYGVTIMTAKYRGNAELIDKDAFFSFLSEKIVKNKAIISFEDIDKIFNASTRKENVEASGSSKNNFTRVFDKVVILQREDGDPILYKDVSKIQDIGQILAVENAETFLNIYSLMSKFGFKNFVYLGGFSNTATKKFLQDKDVVFYLDYDIEAIRIYDSFTCREKHFFRHPDIELYFKDKERSNKELYEKQRSKLPKKHDELNWLIELINNNSTVVEQELVS